MRALPLQWRIVAVVHGQTFTILTALIFATDLDRIKVGLFYLAIAALADGINRRTMRRSIGQILEARNAQVPELTRNKAVEKEQLKFIVAWLVLVVPLVFVFHRTSVPFLSEDVAEHIVLPGFESQRLDVVRATLPSFQVFRSLVWLLTEGASLIGSYRFAALMVRSPFAYRSWSWLPPIISLGLCLGVGWFLLSGQDISSSGTHRYGMTPDQYIFYVAVLLGLLTAFLYMMTTIRILLQHISRSAELIPVEDKTTGPTLGHRV